MRIALWNACALPNQGDRLIDHCMKREIRRRIPEADIVTYSPWKADNTKLYIDFEGLWPGHRQFDAIIIGGGALLTGPPYMSPAEQFFMLGPYPERFQDTAPIHLFGICADTTTLLPFGQSASYAGAFARRITTVNARNMHTADLISQFGCGTRTTISPDIVFSLPSIRPTRYKEGPRRVAYLASQSAFPETTIRLMSDAYHKHACRIRPELMDLKAGLARREAAQDFSSGIVLDEHAQTVHRISAATGCKVTLVAFDNMYGDAQLQLLLRSLPLKFDSLTLVDSPAEDYIRALSQFDVVVATRYHACILAALAGCRVVGIDRSEPSLFGASKLKALFDENLKGELYIPRDKSNPELISDYVLKALQAEGSTKNADRAAKSVDKAFQSLCSFLLNS